MRYGIGVAACTAALILGTTTLPIDVRATYPGPGPTLGCSASAGEIEFGGACVAVPGPGAPTRPAASHLWITQVPEAAASCSPYAVTQWATGISSVGWSWDGSFWTMAGQRVPILYSTPLFDNGWIWTVACGSPGVVRYTGAASLARQPNPCAPGTSAAACRPGYDPPGFLAAVERQLPPEAIVVIPPIQDVVGVPVNPLLQPVPVQEQAVINVTVPDLGDGDPGEGIHVVWVVQATPQAVVWSWPDGTQSEVARWVPQVDERGGRILAELDYLVTAAGFWSDGVTVQQLPSLTVGTIPVRVTLPYSVQQVQSSLG